MRRQSKHHEPWYHHASRWKGQRCAGAPLSLSFVSQGSVRRPSRTGVGAFWEKFPPLATKARNGLSACRFQAPSLHSWRCGAPRLVKLWAKSKAIHTAKDGALSSYGYVMLATSFLQECGGVPALRVNRASGPYIDADAALRHVLDACSRSLCVTRGVEMVVFCSPVVSEAVLEMSEQHSPKRPERRAMPTMITAATPTTVTTSAQVCLPLAHLRREERLALERLEVPRNAIPSPVLASLPAVGIPAPPAGETARRRAQRTAPRAAAAGLDAARALPLAACADRRPSTLGCGHHLCSAVGAHTHFP